MLLQRSAVAFAIVLVAIAAGCASAPSSDASRRGDAPQPVRPPERFDPYPVIAVRKVSIGDRLRGYVKVRVDESDPLAPTRLYFVYDTDFELRGYFTDNGRTFAVRPDGSTRPLGARTHDEALRVLLGASEEGELRLEPMDPPKTI